VTACQQSGLPGCVQVVASEECRLADGTLFCHSRMWFSLIRGVVPHCRRADPARDITVAGEMAVFLVMLSRVSAAWSLCCRDSIRAWSNSIVGPVSESDQSPGQVSAQRPSETIHESPTEYGTNLEFSNAHPPQPQTNLAPAVTSHSPLTQMLQPAGHPSTLPPSMPAPNLDEADIVLSMATQSFTHNALSAQPNTPPFHPRPLSTVTRPSSNVHSPLPATDPRSCLSPRLLNAQLRSAVARPPHSLAHPQSLVHPRSFAQPHSLAQP